MAAWQHLSNRLHGVLVEAERIGDIDYSTYRNLRFACSRAVTAFLQGSGNSIDPPSIAPYLIRACLDIILLDRRVSNEDKEAIAAALESRGIFTERNARAAAAARTAAARMEAAAHQPRPSKSSIAQLQAENAARLFFNASFGNRNCYGFENVL